MTIVSSHDRSDDSVCMLRNEEKAVVHLELFINDESWSIVWRVVAENGFPKSDYLLAMERVGEWMN